MNPKADFFFDQAGKWEAETRRLRTLVLSCGLEEEVKWGCPCYTEAGANIVLIHHFKDYCALLLFKGALLQDPDSMLVQQTKNVQAARQIRFTTLDQIVKQEKAVKSYIYQAIEVEKAGLKVAFKNSDEFEFPEEFNQIIKKNKALKKAFDALTPGRQRAYALFFSQPKQSQTRTSRVEKSISKILEGKGPND